MKEKRKELKNKAKSLSPEVIIGKNGITENLMNEIINRLKSHGMIKVKMLPVFARQNDKIEVPKQIARDTKSRIINRIGFTFVLKK